MENMTHTEVIEEYSRTLVAGGKVVGFESGMFYRPDILTIDSSLRVIEYEVKVKEQSFINELKIIESVAQNRERIISLMDLNTRNKNQIKKYKTQAPKRKNKYAKHLHYLKGIHQYGKPSYRPNKFYFVMPEKLYKKYQERLAKLPYGVIIITEGGKQATKRIKVASALHYEALPSKHLWYMTYHLSYKFLQKENQ